MISDDCQHIRELGLEHILQKRVNQDKKRTQVSVFKF